MSEKFVSFRIAKGVSTTSIRNKIIHDNREGYIPKNVDSSRSELNYNLVGDLRAVDVSETVERLKDRVKVLSGRKAQANAEMLHTGVMTFSAEMKKDYEENPEAFNENALNFIQRIDEVYGLQVINAVVHLDETTPHIELVFDNIDRTTGKGIRRGINPRKLSKIQDLMGECFSSMGYERGKSKVETFAEHSDSNAFYELQEMKELLELLQEGNPEIAKIVEVVRKEKEAGRSLKSSTKKKIAEIVNASKK